ncbi:TadE/TadG family type IV pilus assembly protein [Streptomyces sp. NPDC127038]|uniref:TadE/TadG family type IV pilus assembly protein n=1 Tax=Streptomyces sp. NPDC127038 TaxID=3347114 RepID=UPI0036488381
MNTGSRWRRRHAQGGDRGGMEVFYAGVVLVAFLFIGLVIDGGLALDAQSDADYIAQEAARAGAQQIDPAQAITGEALVLDPDAARQAALAFLTEEGLDGEAAVGGDGQTLTVTVHDTYHPYFATLIGVTSMPVTGHGTATLLHQAGG